MFEGFFKKQPDPEMLRNEDERTNQTLNEAQAFIEKMREPEVIEKERRDAFVREKLGEMKGREDDKAA